MSLLRHVKRILLAAVATAVLAPSPARADFLVEPFFAWSRNRDTAQWHTGGGVAVNWSMNWFVAGADLGYAAGFFDPDEQVTDLIQSSHVLTISGQAGVAMPMRDEATRLLPYATAGFGVMRQQARDRVGLVDVTRNDPAINIGGGVRAMLTEYLGISGDLRYFRSMRDPYESPDPLVADLERLGFWRVGVGAVVRFGSD